MVWSNQAPTTIVFPPGATTGARLIIDSTGITLYNNINEVVFQLDSTGAAEVSFLNLLNSNAVQVGDIYGGNYTADNGLTIESAGGLIVLGVANEAPLQIMAGPPGYYLAQQYALSGTANNSSTLIPGMTLSQSYTDSEYGPIVSAGVATIPVAGFYDCTASVKYTTSFGSGNYGILERLLNSGGTLEQRSVTSSYPVTASWSRYYNQGDKISLAVFQNSGAALVLDNTESYWSICRRI